ncbi:MAG: T9SS type A sorting domain-containing protein [Saprospiraceae bacterium]|nr:T9SS type A sorting domain-containing protein [Saprospiraceae bacterium]
MKKGLFILSLFSFLSVQAQEIKGICGMTAEHQHAYDDRLIANLAAVESGIAADRGGVQYVPVFFHLTADGTGSGRAREFKALEGLCGLNAAFEPTGIQFYLSPHPTLGLFDKTISNTNVYTNQFNELLMNLKRHQNAINFFIVNECDYGSNPQGGTILAYYSPGRDWVVCRKDELTALANNSTLPHETGHFFSLQHPFIGWEESNGFGPGYPGWPIAPVTAPGGGPTEKMDGSNCTVAADKICDTPPDYKFAWFAANCAPYNGGAKDPMGVLVDPMENNMMSYWDACSTYQFTPLQSAAMSADLSQNDRNYLDNSFTPPSLTVESPTDLLVSPANSATVPFYNSVQLTWNAAPGATHYLVEIDETPGYVTANLQIFITTNTSLALTNLNANDNYYWRVKPFNYYATCAPFKSRSFKTSNVATATVDIEGLEAWQVAPNPVEGNQASLIVHTNSGFEANVQIVDAAGKLVSNLQTVPFAEGANTVELPLDGLANGFYFVVLDNGKARDVRKMVVAK